MAVRDWTWPLVAVAGCVLLAVWLLPPDGIGSRRVEDESALERRADSLSTLSQTLRVRYRRAVWRDSVEALLSREDPGPGSLLLRLPEEGAMGEVTPMVRDAAHREIPRSGVASGRRIVVVHLDSRLGDLVAELEGREGSPPRPVPIAQYYVGDEPVPYCAVVLPDDPESSARRRDLARGTAEGGRSLLGPCYFLARYGSPGSSVSEWMAEGGWRFSERHPSPVEEAGLTDRPVPIGAFGGALGTPFMMMAPSVEACLSGSDTGCVDAVVDPLWITANAWDLPSWSLPVRFAPAVHDVSRYGPMPPLFREPNLRSISPDYDASLLRDMERDLGAEGFGRFWRSDDPLEEAFRSVAGISMGRWIGDWSRPRFPTRTRGADIDGRSLLLSLLTLGGLGGLALWTPRWWKVT